MEHLERPRAKIVSIWDENAALETMFRDWIVKRSDDLPSP
jgi:hypothetical protein